MTAPSPLRKRSLKGELYTRTSGIEDKLHELITLPQGEIVTRCAVEDAADPKHVPSECLMYFVRANRENTPGIYFETIYNAVLRRVMEQLPPEDDNNLTESEIRYETLGSFAELLAADRMSYEFNHGNTNTVANIISGSGAVTVNGSGVEILTAANTYSGGTVINAGTLRLNAAGSAGSGPITNNNAILALSDGAGGGNTFANIIRGAGTINVIGNGTAPFVQLGGTLAGFSGVLNIGYQGAGRFISRSNNGGLVGAAITVNVTNGGQLFIQSGVNSCPLNLSGPGDGDGLGALRIDGQTFSGATTLTGNASVGANGTGTISGSIGDNGSGYGITVSAGRINYSGVAGLYFGNTTINGGTTLGLVNGSAIENSPAINIASNATFDVSGDGLATYPIPTGLVGASTTQRLAGIGQNGKINGSIALGSGGSLGVAVANDGRPSLIVTNGTLTLTNNPVIVTESALPLTGGIYPLVGVATNGAVGTVAGDVSTSPLSFAGAGLGNGASASLAISNSILYLVVSQPPASPAVFSGVSALPNNGGLQLIFNGSNGHNYSLLASTNVALPLTNWVTVTTGSFLGQPVTNIDLGMTNFPQRFYRILSQ